MACGGEQSSTWQGRSHVIASRIATPQGDSVVFCRISDVKDTFELPLSTFVDSLEIIRLDNKKKKLTTYANIIFSDNYIVINPQDFSPSSLFTRKGMFVCDFEHNEKTLSGHKTPMDDAQIDEKHDKIYLTPHGNGTHLFVYDLKGNQQKSIPFPFKLTKGCTYVDYDRQQICMVHMVFDDAVEVGGYGPSVAWVQDFEGNLIYEANDSAALVYPDYCDNCIYAFDRNSDFVSFSVDRMSINRPKYPFRKERIYHYYYKENKLKPVLAIDNGESKTGVSLKEFPRFYTMGIYEGNPWDGYKINKEIVLDKNTLKGGYYTLWNDLMAGIPLKGRFMECGYMITTNMEKLKAAIGKRLQDKLSEKEKEILQRWQKEVTQGDCDYIIRGNYKE